MRNAWGLFMLLALLLVGAGRASAGTGFNVSGAASLNATTVQVTFDAAPDAAQATTLANYSVPGLTLSGVPTLVGNTVTITTSPQAAQTYTVTVSGVTRAADAAPLIVNSANFADLAFDVVSAASVNQTTMSVTFDAPPNIAQATTLANYSVSGLTLAGVPSLAGDTVTITTSPQAAQTYTVTVSGVTRAADGAPLTVDSASFTVSATFGEQFLAPLVQSTDATSPVLNTGKNGRVIPVKVQISEGATTITNVNAPGPVTIAVSKLASCSSIAGTDPVTSYADAGQSSAGTNLFNYDPTAQAWVYNLDTKALGLVTGNCYRLDVSVSGAKVADVFAVFEPTK